MKLENNWKSKTLENLEKDTWKETEFDSYLVRKMHDLRKVSLEKFTTEDLRILIGQEIGLDYLIPLVLEVLSENLWAEGDFFEGDLLKSVLSITTNFWISNKNHWVALHGLIKDSRTDFGHKRIDTSAFDKVQFVL